MAREHGQATIEFLAMLPLVVAVALSVWQAAVAGHAIWSASAAARSASRVAALGGDAEAAVRRVAGPRARGRVAGGGAVRVTVPIRAVTGGSDIATFSTTARFEPQR